MQKENRGVRGKACGSKLVLETKWTYISGTGYRTRDALAQSEGNTTALPASLTSYYAIIISWLETDVFYIDVRCRISYITSCMMHKAVLTLWRHSDFIHQWFIYFGNKRKNMSIHIGVNFRLLYMTFHTVDPERFATTAPPPKICAGKYSS